MNHSTLTRDIESVLPKKERLAGIRIPFVANTGQTDPAVAFYAPTFAGTVFVTRDGQIVYSLLGKSAGPEKEPQGRPRAVASAGWSLTESPIGATGESRRARPVGQNRAQTQVSYFLGNDSSAWRSGIATYEGVSLGRVWPGVSLSLHAHGKNVEKLFTVEPGADPSRIRMRVSGARSLRAEAAGGLIASTGPGDVRLTRPEAYQEQGGARRAVAVAYEARGDTYGFRVGSYDNALPVVIDPLLQATYLGGSSDENGTLALAIHPTSGDVYVVGQTNSTNFPGTTGGAQATYGSGSSNAFVARLNASLTTLTQATYLGGSGYDQGFALAIHPTSGDVYVGGIATSTDFPGTAGGAQAANAGAGDAFVARLNAALTTLTQATYLGGGGNDECFDLAIHPTSGDVYVVGPTNSTNLPGTAGGAQAAFGGSFDAFAARLNASLTSLIQATYLGGSNVDSSQCLAIHPTSGDVYVTLYTNSTDFPGTIGGAQPANAGGFDALVARLNASLTTLTQATYLGGSGDDFGGLAMAIHPTSGDVYAAGWTTSTNFPGTAGGVQAPNGGGTDAFVARLNAALTTLTQATYLGGSGHDEVRALAIHPTSGDVYAAGFTNSTDFPSTTSGAQPANAGSNDAVVARLNASLTTLAQATYLGGSGDEFNPDLAIHPTSGDVYVAGYTNSTDFPGTTGGAQASNGGGYDAFVARFSPNLASAPESTPSPTVTPGPTATPTPRTPTSNDACMNEGWRSLTRADGSSFKNQGDCIQYVNTGK